MKTIDRKHIASLMEREREILRQRHPRSGQLAAEAKGSLLFGVPMNWMTRWPGDHPVYVDCAAGARFRDELLDPCIHLYLLNRGILMTTFQNMALISPATTAEDVDRHTRLFDELAGELTGN